MASDPHTERAPGKIRVTLIEGLQVNSQGLDLSDEYIAWDSVDDSSRGSRLGRFCKQGHHAPP